VQSLAGCGAAYLEVQALAALADAIGKRGDTTTTTTAAQARDRAEALCRAAGLSDEDRSHYRPDL
jgi:hypothetical protein